MITTGWNEGFSFMSCHWGDATSDGKVPQLTRPIFWDDTDDTPNPNKHVQYGGLPGEDRSAKYPSVREDIPKPRHQMN